MVWWIAETTVCEPSCSILLSVISKVETTKFWCEYKLKTVPSVGISFSYERTDQFVEHSSSTNFSAMLLDDLSTVLSWPIYTGPIVLRLLLSLVVRPRWSIRPSRPLWVLLPFMLIVGNCFLERVVTRLNIEDLALRVWRTQGPIICTRECAICNHKANGPKEPCQTVNYTDFAI